MKNEAPDQHALNVARAVQEAVASATVILFGSRAKNRHRENSDIDLLIVTDDGNPPGAEIRARNTAYAYLKANPPGLAVDVFSMTRGEFDRCRRANQHIAGQAARYGVVMNGENLDYSSDCQDSYPAHWPETRQRLENVEEYLHQFNQMIDESHWNQRLLGFIAQQAVENALKGWLSARNDARTYNRELTGLWKDIVNVEDWSNPNMDQLHQAVANLFACIHYNDPDRPGEESDWLTKYAVTYRYGRASHRMTRDQRITLHQAMNDALAAVMDRIHTTSGTSSSDLWREGPKPWG